MSCSVAASGRSTGCGRPAIRGPRSRRRCGGWWSRPTAWRRAASRPPTGSTWPRRGRCCACSTTSPTCRPAPGRDELRGLILRARVDVREDPTARVLVCDLRAARTLDADVVLVLGLEQGGISNRADDAFLPDALRDALGEGLHAAEPGDLERHLLYVALARGRRRVVVVRRSASDDGRPLEPSPLWLDVARAAGGATPVRRRGLADVAWTVEAAPTTRERTRAICRLSADDPRRAERIADADGIGRRLRRARTAYQRPTRIRDPQVLADLRALDRFPVTTLERFGDCSSWWFVERHLNPRDIDAAYDARLAGTIAHAALQRFYRGVPATFGKDRLEPGDADRAEQVIRELVDEAMRGQTLPSDTLEARIVARRVARDLARFVRQDAEQPVAARADPARGRVRRRQLRARPEGRPADRRLRGGGQDRPDRHRPVVLGARARAGLQVRQDRLVGPAAERRGPPADPALHPGRARAARAGADRRPVPRARARRQRARRGRPRRGDVAPPGLVRTDLVERDELWRIVDVAREQAVEIVGRIRAGDVRHDPRGGSCPWYCPWDGVCRIAR